MTKELILLAKDKYEKLTRELNNVHENKVEDMDKLYLKLFKQILMKTQDQQTKKILLNLVNMRRSRHLKD